MSSREKQKRPQDASQVDIAGVLIPGLDFDSQFFQSASAAHRQAKALHGVASRDAEFTTFLLSAWRYEVDVDGQMCQHAQHVHCGGMLE